MLTFISAETITHILMFTFITLPASVGLILQANQQHEADKAPERRDLAFSNTLYTCPDDTCDRNYFRMYQVFEAYRLGQMRILGDAEPNEKTYGETLPVELVDSLGLVRCPTCGTCGIQPAKKFDWMKTDPVFPELSYNQLTERRTGGKTKKELETMLAATRKQINDIDEVASYQHHYGLHVDAVEKNVDTTIQDIQETLRVIARQTVFPDIRKEAAALIADLNVTGPDRFRAKAKAPDTTDMDDMLLEGFMDDDLTAETKAKKLLDNLKVQYTLMHKLKGQTSSIAKQEFLKSAKNQEMATKIWTMQYRELNN